jgi:hypothetical protein
MADQIGRISVPLPVKSGATFPLVTEYGYGMTRDWKIVEHRFGDLATLGVQRYAVGSGARRFQFVKSSLTYLDRQNLLDFYDNTQGSYQSFTYPAPNTDRATFTNYEAVFDTPPLSITELVNRAQTGLTFLEIIDPASAPPYTINSVWTRFPPDPPTDPADSLAKMLASEVQVIIPLVHIKVRNTAVPDIYFSDRRVNISGFPGTVSNPTTFLPRLLSVGVPGMSDVIMSQSIDGRADNVRFVFGNADRAMSMLINDCSLEFAQIDLSLLHVGSLALIQLWKGVVISWQIDGSAQMSVTCSDGLYPVTQVYPPRTVSRQCWKPFNTQILPGYKPCPFAEQHGPLQGTDPNILTVCDYNYNSPNGCLAHGMSQFFGGHPEQPQSVVIKDNGTGIVGGFFRSTITSTSILSDSIWGNPLPEIWCNNWGVPMRAYFVNCLVAAVRDETSFMDVLGIVGAGPIGGFEGMSIQTNTDGYKLIVAPLADGYVPQGFKLDGQLDIVPQPPDQELFGLRQSVGNDPAALYTTPYNGNDAFSLGQGTPQHWEEPDPNFTNFSNSLYAHEIIPYAAGTALCEIRYSKQPTSGGIQPTAAESHNMQVPLRMGLTGSVFDTNGNRTLTPGLVNPYWVAANTYLRALGLQSADAPTQLSYLVLNSITDSDGEGCADIADLMVDPIVGNTIPPIEITESGAALPNWNLDYNNGTFTFVTPLGEIVAYSLSDAEANGWIVINSASGQEIQFQFQGAVAEFKPFRDWVNEILNCALGYWCFEFGKLKMGIRYSAVPTDAFTVGTMLYQSLTVTPISAAFEYLKCTFANVELQYQMDLAEYQDKDHALYYGRAGAPLTSSMRSPGCSTLSQGLRVVVTRTREEIGGIMRGVPYNGIADVTTNSYIEWDQNKRVSFKSTLLALTTEIGQVVTVTHPDIATYPGAHPASRSGSNGAFPANTWPFRIEKWMLHSDWSVSVQARSCVDSMYDLEVGPQPQGVGPRPLPIMFFPEPLGQWAPYQVQADPADALWPNEFSFNLQQTFQYGGDGRLLTSAVVAGILPVNQFVPDCGAPDVKKGGAAWSSTGGGIPAGTTLYVQICAAVVDTTQTPNVVQQYSPPSEILILQVPFNGVNTNSLTINNIRWPNNSALNGWVLFANTAEDLICGQESGDGLPASITFTGPVARQTYAVPDFDLDILRLRAQVLIHGGVLGAGVDSVTTTSIFSHATIDPARKDDWNDRVLAIIGRQQGDGIAPWTAFNITHFDTATGEFVLDRDPTAVSVNNNGGPVQVGDIFVVCFAGYDNSANPYVIGDKGLNNGSNIPPHTGETPNDPNRIGRMVRVIKGTSRGKSAKIVSNDQTNYTLDQPLPIDATSIWIVCDPGWTYSKDVVVNNADPSNVTLSAIEINNYDGLALLVEGVTIDDEGVIIDDADACVRMLYIPGVQGTSTTAAT